MTDAPSLPAQMDKVRWHIEYWKSRNLSDHAQEMCDVLVTLQQHERLEDELHGACLDRDSYKARVKQLDDACDRFMREVALLREQHERLEAEIAEVESGYKNAAELVLTYHGKNERLEAGVKAARDLLRHAGIKHPGADNVIVSRERVHTLESALAAVDTAAPETPHG